MIKYQIEKWQTFWPDFKQVWEKEHRKFLYGDDCSYSLNHFLYAEHEAQGNLFVVTARHDDFLVGYIVALKLKNVPFMGLHTVNVAFYFVREEYRQRGIFNELFDNFECWLANFGPLTVYVSTKSDADYSEIFEKKFFEQCEITLRKDYNGYNSSNPRGISHSKWGIV